MGSTLEGADLFPRMVDHVADLWASVGSRCTCPNPTDLSAGHARSVAPRATRAAYVTADGDDVECDLADLDLRAVAQGAPARIPPSYAGQKDYPGLFWSSTNADHVVYESRLELEWLWLADFDSKVVRIAAQPMRIVGDDGYLASVHPPSSPH